MPKFSAGLDYFTWSHLWFLIYLLTFTLVWWPLSAGLRRGRDVEFAAVVVNIYRPIPALRSDAGDSADLVARVSARQFSDQTAAVVAGRTAPVA